MKRKKILFTVPSNEIEWDETDKKIIEGIRDGLTVHHIADKVFLSCRTVENRISAMLKITGAGSRTELVLMAIEEKMIEYVPKKFKKRIEDKCGYYYQ